MIRTRNTLRAAAIAAGMLGFMGSACLAEDNQDQPAIGSAATGSPSAAISLDGAAATEGAAQAEIPDGASVDSSTETANADAAAEKGKTSQ